MHSHPSGFIPGLSAPLARCGSHLQEYVIISCYWLFRALYPKTRRRTRTKEVTMIYQNSVGPPRELRKRARLGILSFSFVDRLSQSGVRVDDQLNMEPDHESQLEENSVQLPYGSLQWNRKAHMDTSRLRGYVKLTLPFCVSTINKQLTATAILLQPVQYRLKLKQRYDKNF